MGTTPSQTPPPFKFRHFASQDTKTATMPKEKTTRKAASKGADKSAGGKRKKDPGIKFGEVGKILGEKWKGLNDKQKAPYEAKAAADKKRYEEEKAAYTAGGEDEDEEE